MIDKQSSRPWAGIAVALLLMGLVTPLRAASVPERLEALRQQAERFEKEAQWARACELYAETHRQVDRLLLPLVLEHTKGNQYQASRQLGIARQTLRLKLRDLGLSVTHHAEVEEDDPS